MLKTKNRGKWGWSRNVSTDNPTLDIYADGTEMFQICGDATAQDTFEESSTQLHEIGARRVLPDGRVFKYCYAATALYGGMGAHDGGVIGNYTLAAGAQAAGSTSLVVPDTDATHVADWWKNGYISVEGYGPWYSKITASTASDGSTITITTEAATDAAVETDKVSLYRSPYAAVTRGMTLGATTAKIMTIVCVPPIAVTAEYYFWGQTWGPCGGCPVAFMGDSEYERDLVFQDTDGAVGTATSRIADGKGYQKAGWILGRHTSGTDCRNPVYWLQITPW
jgi:hypothetical protein